MLQHSAEQQHSGRAARPGDDAAAAAQQQDGAADGRRQDDAGHMGLKHEQDDHRDEGQQRDDEFPHDALIEPLACRDAPPGGGVQLFQMGRFRGQMGREQYHLKLCDLRYLNGKADAQPAAAAVEGRTEQHRDEHHDADDIARPDHPAQKAVVDAGEEQHDRETQTQAEHLRLDVVEAVAHPQVARGVAGTEQHDESEHDDDCQRRQPVDEHLRPGAGARQDGKGLRLFSPDGRHPHSLLIGSRLSWPAPPARSAQGPALPGLQKYKRYSPGQSPAFPASGGAARCRTAAAARRRLSRR